MTVPTFSYCPASAGAVAVKVAVPPAAREATVPMCPSMSSSTDMLVKVQSPVFSTMNVKVTVSPTSTNGPVGSSASSAFTFFSRSIEGLMTTDDLLVVASIMSLRLSVPSTSRRLTTLHAPDIHWRSASSTT